MIVYALVNEVNSKVYVGQHHGTDVSKRWNTRLSNNKFNIHLSAAIQKYGAKSFSKHVLCYCSCQQEMDLLEQYWITILQTQNPKFGYNMLGGGQLWRGHHNKETKLRIKEALRRYWDNAPQAVRDWRSRITRREWRSRTKAERVAIAQKVRAGLLGRKGHPPWNAGLRGLPSLIKGKKLGPHKHPRLPDPPKSEAHKKHISEALKRYFATHPRRKGPRHACCI